MNKPLFVYLVALLTVGFHFTGLAAEQGVRHISDDKNLEELVSAGRAYLDTGLYEKAIEHFRNIADMYPATASAQYYLGFVYYKSGDMENAEKLFKKAVTIDPQYAEAYYYLGAIENKKGDHEKVLDYLNKVVSLDKTVQSAYYNKGVTFLVLNKPELAVKEFAYALYLAPADISSLTGILEAYERLNLIKVQKRDLLGHDFYVPGNNAPDRYGNKKEDPRIFLVTPSGRQRVKIEGEKPVELTSLEDRRGSCEMDFPGAKDLRNKSIRFQVRGIKGDEQIKLMLRDKATTRSSVFFLKGITKEWKTFSVAVEENTFAYIDLSQVKNISFGLLPPKGLGKDRESMIFIRKIEIISTD
ncbi:MAG: hypothetical protein DRP85_07875 [Candidatus Makaraimicrobium thalassicum]|nr:MAG: hypothetical protein DRP85_07875 [Candidatus Omnitrophota bacterium]